MGLFKRLTEKPWLDENPNVAEPGAAPHAASNRKAALVFLPAIPHALFFAHHTRLAPVELGGQKTDRVPTPAPPGMLALFANS